MKHVKYDLAVIGGGPTGMIAAGRAAELGSKVILLEKNNILGKKLLLTGKGRCNITNAEENIKKLMKKYGSKGRFLHYAFGKFSNKKVIDFFEKHEVKTKVERGKRVFPYSDKSADVVKCLMQYMCDGNVQIKYNSSVVKIIIDTNRKIEKVILNNGEEIIADNYAFTTGGKSYPRTGSTGDGFKLLNQIGHTVVTLKPSLTPVIVCDKIVSNLEGLKLKNVEVSLWKNTKLDSYFGEANFSNNGLDGPVILNLSKKIGEQKSEDLKIKIDFKPVLDYPTLDKRIQRDFNQQKNKQFKNCLNKLLPKQLIPVIIKLSGIEENRRVNEIKKNERKKIISLLKQFELSVKRLVGFEKAIITSGGINLKEVNSKTMKSKLIKNLYIAGEILDLDGPTGGYNLQIAWSTGYMVGENSKK